MNLNDILNHHLKGGLFEYKSFDFKKAKSEYELSKEYEDLCKVHDSFSPTSMEIKDKYQLPDELIEKYAYFRKGKLRSVHFTPCGSIMKVLIGARYAISYYDYNLKDNVKLI